MRDTWGAPNTGWPSFCDKCGKRRQWEAEPDASGDLIDVDVHKCGETQ